MGIPDLFTILRGFLDQLNAQQTNVLLAHGETLFSFFAVILVTFYGIRTVLAKDSFSAAGLFQVGVSILLCRVMLWWYVSPIPGIGDSFTGLIIHESAWLAAKIGGHHFADLTAAYVQMETHATIPGAVDFGGTLYYFTFMMSIALLQVVILLVAAFGLIMQTVLLIVGPVFVPFFIVPGLEFMFWGWFKCFLQYSFYQLIATAWTWAIAQLAIVILQRDQAMMQRGDWSYLSAIPAILAVALLAAFGALLIPSITASIFSGSSGHGPLDAAGSARQAGSIASGGGTSAAGAAASGGATAAGAAAASAAASAAPTL